MTAAENLLAVVDRRWPGGRSPDDPFLLVSWWREIRHLVIGHEAGIDNAGTGLRGALHAARNRRATALQRGGNAETPESEREVELIRALGAYAAEIRS